MPDRKKKPTKKPSADRKSKELDTEQLEQVSGGILNPAPVSFDPTKEATQNPQFKWAARDLQGIAGGVASVGLGVVGTTKKT